MLISCKNNVLWLHAMSYKLGNAFLKDGRRNCRENTSTEKQCLLTVNKKHVFFKRKKEKIIIKQNAFID